MASEGAFQCTTWGARPRGLCLLRGTCCSLSRVGTGHIVVPVEHMDCVYIEYMRCYRLPCMASESLLL